STRSAEAGRAMARTAPRTSSAPSGNLQSSTNNLSIPRTRGARRRRNDVDPGFGNTHARRLGSGEPDAGLADPQARAACRDGEGARDARLSPQYRPAGHRDALVHARASREARLARPRILALDRH